MLVLYLSNRYIRAVQGSASGGKFSVKRACHTVDAAGCILNGVVTDEEGFLELMQSFWRENRLPKKKVFLVLGGGEFTAKTTEAPVQKPSKMLGYLQREFSEVDRIAEPVYGYFKLPHMKEEGKKLQTVFAMAASREYLESYRALFGKLGVTLSGIEPVMGTMQRLLWNLPQVEGMTGILQFVDDITLLNAVIVNGQFYYSSTNRLYSDPGTMGYPVEAARSVSNLLQFVRAQGVEEPIRTICVSGFAQEDLEIYIDSIRQIDDRLETQELDIAQSVKRGARAAELEVPGMALALGGLVGTDDRTNILRNLTRDAEKEAARRRSLRTVLPLAGLVLAAGALTGAAVWKQQQLQEELQMLQNYNNSDEVQAVCEAYDAVNFESSSLSLLADGMRKLRQCVLEYPLVDSSAEEVVKKCAQGLVSAVISGYDSKTGVISFDTEAQLVDQIHQFAELLGRQEIFASVDYTGYSQDSSGVWHVKVDAVMAGRQEEQ